MSTSEQQSADLLKKFGSGNFYNMPEVSDFSGSLQNHGDVFSSPIQQQNASTEQSQLGQDILTGLQNMQIRDIPAVSWAAIQQALLSTKQNQQLTADSSAFVPGAISNRTLEHLTETMHRPSGQCRAIKGTGDVKLIGSLHEPNHDGASNKVGTIGDSRPQSTSQASSSYAPVLQSSPCYNTSGTGLGLNLSNIGQNSGNNTAANAAAQGVGRNSPADSDTSGISTGSDLSEAAMLDLLYNLQMKVNTQTQTSPPNPIMQASIINQSSRLPMTPVNLSTPVHQYGSMGLTSQVPCPPGFGGLQQQQPMISQMDILRALSINDYSQNMQYSMLGSYPNNLGMGVHALPGLFNTQMPSMTATGTPDYASSNYDQERNKLVALASLLQGTLGNGWQGEAATAPNAIEKAAKLHRNAAAVCEATCTWSGQLPPKIYKNPTYSCKVFLGGVPWDITEAGLQTAFKMFGTVKIEWPQEGKHRIRNPMKAGYVYVLFESDRSVKGLLQACTHDFSNGGEYYYKISSKRMRSKEVQVIPWVLSDSNYVKQPSQRLDPTKTVFVGALHGMMNAEGLAHIMNDLFGNVVYAGIDTDKHKYPIGSGRVTFSSHKSFMKAVNAAFVEVKTPKFTKKIQIDPYLEDSMCNICAAQAGPYFCRDLLCFRYYCQSCWQWNHSLEATRNHKPLMRNNARANAEVNGLS